MRKLILRNFQSPGDITMLTAAVRDLHRAHPGEFLTDVRTSCPALWDHNPYVTSIADDERGVEVVDCHYPLIHRSNQVPCHFLHGFVAHLNEQLGLSIRVTEFKGDIHISDNERASFARVETRFGTGRPFWLFVSGGKHDFTIKWWDPARMQSVVEYFRDRFDFVQVGEAGHHHPPIEGAVDLRGATSLRELVRLVHHAQGVVSPISLLMHLAAAVETKPGAPRNRPCVVVAGGREPPHGTAYPHHQFIHTLGALRCCDNGGCWKSRTLPIGDGDEKDRHPIQEIPHRIVASSCCCCQVPQRRLPRVSSSSGARAAHRPVRRRRSRLRAPAARRRAPQEAVRQAQVPLARHRQARLHPRARLNRRVRRARQEGPRRRLRQHVRRRVRSPAAMLDHESSQVF